jgi:hypothetical protein
MIWIAPSEKDAANSLAERRRWAAVGAFHAESGVNPSEWRLESTVAGIAAEIHES